MDFGRELLTARLRAGLTQQTVSVVSGVARPNVAAYEAGRREPRTSTATRLFAAVGVELAVEHVVQWSWTDTARPYAVPSNLWRLPPHVAMCTIETETHLWWSGPSRTFDLAVRGERRRAYELVLREGGPADIEAIVDGLLLIDLFPELVLPAPLRAAWLGVLGSAMALESAARVA